VQSPVILSACRTPIGKFGGALSSIPAPELGAVAIRESVARAGIRPDQVAEVIMGNVLSAGVGQAPARQAALQAGLPPSVAALTINKVCGSGLKAVMLASQAIHCGDADVIVAGGMESMSRAPYLLPRSGAKLGDRTLCDSMLLDGLRCAHSGESMGAIAERLARSDGITRQQQDAFATESHRRAVAAIERGVFAREIVPVVVQDRGRSTTVTSDEGPRPGTSVEILAGLKPSFAADGTVTAGNSSMISDGAAAVVVASQQFTDANELTPMARIVAYATSGAPPDELFTAPVAAIETVLAQCGRTARDIDLYEINEAFAVQMLACLKRLKIPGDKVNVHGGAIALGHPIGASGARVLATLLHALQARNLQTGLAALCLGGGNAVAMVVERT
jgi:acetyl-CoA C-acetyltransferase